MLRTLGKTTLLAALVGSCCGLLTPSAAVAQQAVACQCGVPGCGLHGGGVLRNGFCQHHQQFNCRERGYGQPELFYNYYVPGTCGGVPANLYLAPRPVPPLVGHTYYTYQPFMPHELLYQHHRTYYRYYNGGRGMTRVHVKWSRPPFTH